MSRLMLPSQNERERRESNSAFTLNKIKCYANNKPRLVKLNDNINKSNEKSNP